MREEGSLVTYTTDTLNIRSIHWFELHSHLFANYRHSNKLGRNGMLPSAGQNPYNFCRLLSSQFVPCC